MLIVGFKRKKQHLCEITLSTGDCFLLDSDYCAEKALKEDMEITEAYNVSASPSVIWQGRTVTDMGSLGNIPGLEGFKQNYGGNVQAAPQGQC